MATSKNYYARPSYRFLSSDSPHLQSTPESSPFELDESDLYNNSDNSPDFTRKPTVSNSRLSKKQTKRSDPSGGTPASLPVNVPDWSKILKDEYRDNRRAGSDDDEMFGDESVRVPPHEFLARQMARTRIVSFSVHEGVGRTLKGGDLTRVRNAIWEKTGFQD
ncbi:Senescence regulator [Melia azedarach]|uniref:Senescence regulator n=1 Tax=Melia azedarach TaxID=155640 RepID=A0ACC1YSM9_MELAZ|nr:Senescence regulator [Melia azedarach]